jgi:hypothetical protein
VRQGSALPARAVSRRFCRRYDIAIVREDDVVGEEKRAWDEVAVLSVNKAKVLAISNGQAEGSHLHLDEGAYCYDVSWRGSVLCV